MNIKNSWLVRGPIAHRGLHTNEIPENSLAAFENAVLHDYAIELDVRLTDDDVPVVFHDETLKRMTGADGYVTNIKSTELDNYRLGESDQTIPTFERTLEFIGGRTPILIEIKNQGKVNKLESKVAELLDAYGGQFAVQSFNPYSLEYFRKKTPGVLRGQLSMMLTKEEQPSLLKRYLLSRLKLNHISKPDFIAYRGEDLPNLYVTKASLPVLAWTIRSNAEMERVAPHCDNIIFEKFIPQITREFGIGNE
ncbi:MAG: glycerophosphodiester phosphodiesterase [Firmicutes bacterium]|nr:glycerophosphodiester phosphodiesterase [Bacillota bacterium]